MSAIAGFTNELGFSVYGGAKFALEGVSEAMHGEAGPLGIKVTIVELGPFRTDFIRRSLIRAENTIEDYNQTSGKFIQFLDKIEGSQPGDPDKAANVLIQVVESDNPPLRLVLGKYAYQKFRQKLESLKVELNAWEAKAANTDFETALRCLWRFGGDGRRLRQSVGCQSQRSVLHHASRCQILQT